MVAPTSPFSAFAPPVREQGPLRRRITAACRTPEPDCIAALLPEAEFSPDTRDAIRDLAARLITELRAKGRYGGVEALVQEYSLSSSRLATVPRPVKVESGRDKELGDLAVSD